MDAVLIGNLGGSIPLGIGSQMAHGHGQTWAFIGDGGFGFYSWDLEVAVERRLPLKIILGNDACWGVEKRLQSNAFGEHVGCDLREVRYDKFAELVGARGIYVDDPSRLDAAVDELMAIEGPALLNVRIRSMAGRPLADFRRY
jgi:acetolactate synthase-1/2/3 large subunit